MLSPVVNVFSFVFLGCNLNHSISLHDLNDVFPLSWFFPSGKGSQNGKEQNGL